MVALLSQAYLDSKYAMLEATTPLNGDPFNEHKRLILLRVEPCTPAGVLTNIDRTDLIPERRQADATALALKILRALGFDNPSLEDIPPPPEEVLARQAQITPEEFRLRTDHLAPRDDLIAAIAEAMRNPVPARRTRTAAITNSRYVMHAVAGMGGVGKTMLALEYARRHAGDYHGIGWIKAETRQGLLQSLADLGARVEPGIAAIKDIEKAAARTLAVIEDGNFAKPWLLVYDNVEKPGALDKLTPSAGAHVLITTRWSDFHGLAGKVDVGVFSPEQAVEFLCERGASSDRDGAAALAKALGYLPLALDHAGSYCRSRRRSFSTYYQDQGRYSEAEPLLERSLAIREKTIGAEHPDTGGSLHSLAHLYRVQGRTAQAEPLIERVLAIYEKTIGPEHPDTAMALDELAHLHLARGRAANAELLLERALPICERAGSVNYLGWILDLAALVRLTGQVAEAEAFARRALTLRCAKLPLDHPEIAQSRWTLARVLIAKGEGAAAESLLKQAIASLEAKVAEGHVWLKGARQTLAELRGAQTAEPGPAQTAAMTNRRWRWLRLRAARS